MPETVTDEGRIVRSQTRSASSVEGEAARKARLRSQRFGTLRDAFKIAPEFDAPLPEEIPTGSRS